MKIKIITPHGELSAEIDETKNPKTAKAVLETLPIVGSANRWGDEIYFEIPVSVGKEHTQLDMEIGDIAYWPPGKSLCIFFGRTPASTTDKPRIYSPGNVIGRVKDLADKKNMEILKKVEDGDMIRIEVG